MDMKCKCCKFFNSDEEYNHVGYCDIAFPAWSSTLLTQNQWEADRKVNKEDSCSFGIEK